MNIVISGGTGGIGRETAIALAADKNNRILATGRNRSLLEDLEQGAEHKNILAHNLDLENFAGYEKAFLKFVSTHFSQVDVLINNAGLLVVGEFLKIKDIDARKMMETNFFGPASLIRSLAPLMKRGTHIVNISSMGGYQGSSKYRGLSFYSSSKAALACLTECLAEEFSDLGIIVNCLALGSVATEMLDKAFPGFKAPVSAVRMGNYIADFAINGKDLYNGKVIPVAMSNP
jgi:NAD(P)-dependent dehydrogenase (short-subunit alcohol dehydrogenase family)